MTILKCPEDGSELVGGRCLSCAREFIEGVSLVKWGSWWIRYFNQPQDVTIINEVYRDDTYRTSLIPDRIAGAKVVVDVGASLGPFARLVHDRCPQAIIVCVEACLENIPALRSNVGEFARIYHAACTYEPGELALLNAVFDHCASTGGSIVFPSAHEPTYDGKYWLDRRLLPKITLEEILSEIGAEKIDLLKLDCEGSEFSILENATARIEFIVGEYHGWQRFDELRRRKFHAWDFGHMHGGELGIFHLQSPACPS